MRIWCICWKRIYYNNKYLYTLSKNIFSMRWGTIVRERRRIIFSLSFDGKPSPDNPVGVPRRQPDTPASQENPRTPTLLASLEPSATLSGVLAENNCNMICPFHSRKMIFWSIHLETNREYLCNTIDDHTKSKDSTRFCLWNIRRYGFATNMPPTN